MSDIKKDIEIKGLIENNLKDLRLKLVEKITPSLKESLKGVKKFKINHGIEIEKDEEKWSKDTGYELE